MSARLAPAVPSAPAALPPSARTGIVLAMCALHALAIAWLMQRMPATAQLTAGTPAPIYAELIRPPAPEPPRVVPPPKVAPEPPRKVVPAPPVRRPVIARKATPRPAETTFVAPPEPPPAVAQEPVAPLEPAPSAPPRDPPPGPAVAVAAAPPARAPAPPKNLSIRVVEYLSLPVLRYPSASRRLMEEGRVDVRVLVDAAGAPRETTIVRSSGYPRLDEAALATVRATRFKPYAENGVPMPFWVVMPLIFELES